jgi:hypothetical protein
MPVFHENCQFLEPEVLLILGIFLKPELEVP